MTALKGLLAPYESQPDETPVTVPLAVLRAVAEVERNAIAMAQAAKEIAKPDVDQDLVKALSMAAEALGIGKTVATFCAPSLEFTILTALDKVGALPKHFKRLT